MIVAVLWGAATIAFIAVKLIPGDPVAILAGGENVVDEEERAALVHQYGLDQPLALRYAHYIGKALSGDFGQSYQYRQPVSEVIYEAAGPTLQLAGSAVALALFLAVSVALATAGRRRSLTLLSSGVELMLLSTPVYWIGIVLLVVDGLQLQSRMVSGHRQ